MVAKVGNADIGTTIMFDGHHEAILLSVDGGTAIINAGYGRIMVNTERLSRCKPATDDPYRRLWLDQKADLERWKSVGGFDKPENLSVENLAAMWEMMQRREEQR